MARAGQDIKRGHAAANPSAQRMLSGVPHLVSDNATPELQLSRIVELEIIPRLMLLHGGIPSGTPPPQQFFTITAAHVETLTHLAVDGAQDRAAQFVSAMVSAGAPPEDIFLQLLSPAAKLMGVLWTDDVYSFSQVTVGLWRLQQVLHEHSQRFRAFGPEGRGHRALLAAEPGAQHTFGVSMLSEFFVRDGWDVHCEPESQWSELQDALAQDSYDMFGLSIGVDASLASVSSAILRLRKASRNRRLFVMVGGPTALTVPDLAERCGADAMASEATAAVELANRWLGPARRAL
jgi:methanogenic corrinoid protein MtbC1